jgi:hypothetical protein
MASRARVRPRQKLLGGHEPTQFWSTYEADQPQKADGRRDRTMIRQRLPGREAGSLALPHFRKN